MGADFWVVVRWWSVLFFVGAAAYPLTKRLFSSWYDEGYLLSRAVGMALATYLVYLGGSLRLIPFTQWWAWAALLTVFLLGLWFQVRQPLIPKAGFWQRLLTRRRILIVIAEELFFLAALLFWSWIKAHDPSIRALEKFMDFGFTKSVLNTTYFPASDMWYAGGNINYYYFGHIVMAFLTKLSGLDLGYTFNLMLASLFALTLTMSFNIALALLCQSKIGSRWLKVFGAFLSAYLVTLGGNLQTIYAWTSGYLGENPPPFWRLFWKVSELGNIGEGLTRYWYANATRFIPFTIHEFPSYSFVVSDVHGHVLSIPFVLLAIALLIVIYGHLRESEKYQVSSIKYQGMVQIGFYGFLVGVLLMTNALDGPIYLGLFIVLSLILNTKYQILSKDWWKQEGTVVVVVLASAAIAALPFLSHFKSFVSGIAVNCPPALLANSRFGPFIFEGVEKCQRSPLWMWLVLWGFFLYCGICLLVMTRKIKDGENNRINWILKLFFLFSLALVIFPEFFYFKDIYPAHFRSNTMFKLGYQAFILFGLVSGYAIVAIFQLKLKSLKAKIGKFVFLVGLAPLLFLVVIYPIFSVRSYFNSLQSYEGLYGLTWLAREYPEDYGVIKWLDGQLQRGWDQSRPATPNLPAGEAGARGVIMTGNPVIVEAEGDSYTDFARFSAFTGLPTIIGWPVHEWLWRGTYDVVAPRREEVRLIYESPDTTLTKQLLTKYHVSLVVVGTLERRKYQELWEDKFMFLGKIAYRVGGTVLYQINP